MRLILSSLFTLFIATVLAQPLTIDNSQLDFGSLSFGDKDSLEVTVTNILDEEITIEELQFFDQYNTSPFYITNAPVSVSAGGQASFYVVFEPVHNIEHNTELIIKTSGNRGAVSVDLNGNCSYSNNYYSETYNLFDTELEEVFEELLADGYQEYSYSGARDEMFMEIDNQAVNGQGSSQNRITRAYIGTDAVGYNNRQDAQGPPYNLNTEHTFPQGNFNQNLPMRSDMHHLFITDINANSTRANFGFGIVTDVEWQEGGSKQGQDASGTMVFEPRDAQKGKTARAVLYFLLRYQNYGGFLTETQEGILRNWNMEFPVTEVESNRNDDIFDRQNNRSPLVDYPQFADRIFNFRLEQDRPDVGELVLSHSEIDFEVIPAGETGVFNLVLTNTGERFLILSNFAITGSGGGAFTFGFDASGNIALTEGESVNIPIACMPSGDDVNLSANLTITTTDPDSPEVSIPLSASTITSISDTSGKPAIQAKPNPFSNYIDIDTKGQSVNSVRIYTAGGKLIETVPNPGQRLDTTDLSPGFYHILIEDKEGGVVSKKMVKL